MIRFGLSLSPALVPFVGGIATPVLTALPKAAQIVDQMSADTLAPQADGSPVLSLGGIKGVLTLSTDPTNNAGVGRNPTYLNNRLNGKPSIKFNSAIRQSLTFGRPAALVNALNSSQGALMFVFKSLGAANQGRSPIFSNTTNNLDTWIINDGAISGKYFDYLPNTETGFQTMMIVKDGTSNPARHRVFINGSPVCYLTNGFNAGSAGDFLVGRGDNNANGGPGEFFTNFELLDMVVWGDTKITAKDGVQAHKWACDKYAQAYPWAGKQYFDVIAGDSIPSGAGFERPHVNVYTEIKASRSIQHGAGLMIVSVGGIDMASMQGQLADDLTGLDTLTGLPLRIVLGEWANQSSSSGYSQISATQNVLNSLQPFRTNGGKIGLWNSTAFGGSGGGNDENSAGVTSAAGNARVNIYGPGIKALTSLYDNFQDIAADTNIGVIGSCPYYPVQPQTPTNTYFQDNKHLTTAAGVPLLANYYKASFNAMV